MLEHSTSVHLRGDAWVELMLFLDRIGLATTDLAVRRTSPRCPASSQTSLQLGGSE